MYAHILYYHNSNLDHYGNKPTFTFFNPKFFGESKNGQKKCPNFNSLNKC